MCLEVDSNELTAEKPITVYKNLNKYDFSEYFYFKYEVGKTYRLRKKLVVEFGRIDRGFHSYQTYITAHYRRRADNVICAFEIPKGAKYYVGKSGDLVSTSIKFIGRFTTND